MVSIITEMVNRIRLSDKELILFKKILDKNPIKNLSNIEKDFLFVLRARVNTRVKILKGKGKISETNL